MKKISLLAVSSIVSLSLFVAPFVHGQEDTTLTSPPAPETTAPAGINIPRADKRQLPLQAPKKDMVRPVIQEKLKDKRLELKATTTSNIKAKLDNVRMDAKQKVEEKRAEIKKRLEAGVKERIKKHTAQIMRHLRATRERLTKLAERVETRINKLKENGVYTEESEALLTTAKAKITTATQAIELIPRELETALAGTTTQRDAFAEIKTIVQKSETALKEAHRALVDVISSLKVGTSTTTKKIPSDDASDE